MNKFMIKLIQQYKRFHANTTSHCRYSPTCSSYSLEAYQKFNFLYATFLSVTRILRCNPLFKPKYDPVPKTRIEKLFILDYPNKTKI